MAIVVGVTRHDEAADAASAILPHVNQAKPKR
jgi:hypothetical protein